MAHLFVLFLYHVYDIVYSLVHNHTENGKSRPLASNSGCVCDAIVGLMAVLSYSTLGIRGYICPQAGRLRLRP